MKKVSTDDPLQKGYVYELTASMGKKFDPTFKPELTPKEMLTLGVFGGAYFEGVPKEFPQSWFKRAKLSESGKEEKEKNYFGINASQSRKVWQEKGWIHKDDPRGWFQWYCRYYLGRRHEDDERQIKRWKAVRRHAAQIAHNCKKGDMSCRRKQRQALLHWAYDSRKT